MTSSLLSPSLVVVCLVMVVVAAVIYRLSGLGRWWVVPGAALRAAVQLAAVAAVLAVAVAQLWSSALVLAVMFVVAAATAARRAQAHGSLWLAVPLASGLLLVIPLLLSTGVVPLDGVAIVPTVGIVLGGTMTAVAVAARRALDTLVARSGEVDAALSLGFPDRDARLEVIRRDTADALIPNVDQARTAGLVTLPGAFIGVLLSTGSAAQAGAVQVLVLVSLLLSQSCAVALTAEFVARGRVTRDSSPVPR